MHTEWSNLDEKFTKNMSETLKLSHIYQGFYESSWLKNLDQGFSN